ncbi:MAG: hypothetical protein KDF63_17070, partial [Rhodoferax sp.]|nr:hypothetical protein [Rhodoferax sp.]
GEVGRRVATVAPDDRRDRELRCALQVVVEQQHELPGFGAFGLRLVERLQAHAGLRFEVDEA